MPEWAPAWPLWLLSPLRAPCCRHDVADPVSVRTVSSILPLFALSNLVIGSSAFVVSGLLGPISMSLGVSVPAAGQAMTVYALSTALLAPLLLVATGGWPRKRALLLALGLLTLGNLVCAMATSLTGLLVGRALMGLGAVFTPLAAGIAVALVEPEQRGKALALVFLGMSLSYVVGIPLGAWFGLRHGWQWAIAAMTLASALTTALVAWRVPSNVRAPGASFAGVWALLRRPPVMWALATTLLYFTAIFCVFSYIGPVLQALHPMSGATLSLTLALFGVSGVVGTLLGGWANDRFGAARSLALQLGLLGAMMALLPLTRGNYALLLMVLVVWGTAGFGMMAPQQSRLAAQSPMQAPLLFSLNTSMLYFGTALGAAVGGAASRGLGFERLAWVGVPFALAAWLTLRISAANTSLQSASPGLPRVE